VCVCLLNVHRSCFDGRLAATEYERSASMTRSARFNLENLSQLIASPRHECRFRFHAAFTLLPTAAGPALTECEVVSMNRLTFCAARTSTALT
jgi:hypothetical protein